MHRIQLDLAVSNRLGCLLNLLYGGACLILLIASFRADWGWGWNILPLIICILSWLYHLQLYIFHTRPRSIISLTYLEASGFWQLRQRNDRTFLAKLCPDSILTSQISLLNFKQDDRFLHRHVLIDQKTIINGDYRQLRKWWRYHGQTS